MWHRHLEGTHQLLFLHGIPRYSPAEKQVLIWATWAERKEKEPACSKTGHSEGSSVCCFLGGISSPCMHYCQGSLDSLCLQISKNTHSEMRHTLSRLDSRNPTLLHSAESHASSAVHRELALWQDIFGTYWLRVFCPCAAKKNFKSACPAAGLSFFQAVPTNKGESMHMRTGRRTWLQTNSRIQYKVTQPTLSLIKRMHKPYSCIYPGLAEARRPHIN